MKTFYTRLSVGLVALIVCVTVVAQQPKPRVSPHDVTTASIAGKRVSIYYGRPHSKNPKGDDIRKIWGGVVPYKALWRLGANESTTLVTQAPLMIGGAKVPAGAYTLYMIPEENGGKLAISKALGQWGIPVDDTQDLARVDLKKETVEPRVDQLTVSVTAKEIRIVWENAAYSVPISAGN